MYFDSAVDPTTLDLKFDAMFKQWMRARMLRDEATIEQWLMTGMRGRLLCSPSRGIWVDDSYGPKHDGECVIYEVPDDWQGRLP